MLKGNKIINLNNDVEISAVNAIMVDETEKKRKLLVLSDLDSRVKWGASLAAFFQSSCEITIMFEEIPPSIRQRYILPNYVVRQYRDLDPILTSSLLFDYDYIILALGGNPAIQAMSAIAERQHEFPTRPLIIAGFNGLMEPGDSHGLLCRQGADVICVNSKRDMAFFRKLSEEFHLDDAPLVLAGYLRNNDQPRPLPQNKPPQNILFVEQVGRPVNLRQKALLMKQLAAYARAHPTRQVVIKLRSAEGVRHTNSGKEKYSFRKLWKKTIAPHPSNVVFSKEGTEDLLPKMDLCISISSTVLFEALAMGKKVAVIRDFGIGTHIGNTSFIGSGLFVSLHDLKNDELPEVADLWFQENASFSESFVEDITARLASLDEQRAHGTLKPIRMFYDRIGFPSFYLKKAPDSRFRKWMSRLTQIRLHFR
ncbi:hypothetical protein ADU59_27445 [Pararhizobium polonicum]|uniref:Uncharacterized protein n=1 Tax=Pararhizobium polonicum TaxID=1612624 RepID=A0A1C7NTC0_9HYPH|nr:DUF6716 putative glycosyltransferase [Pararhizobium polonicum]OBZ92238.1 hypothetical protein ADU59_27445 [Pararhizobium polonicum]